jgi:hypothetical protein
MPPWLLLLLLPIPLLLLSTVTSTADAIATTITIRTAADAIVAHSIMLRPLATAASTESFLNDHSHPDTLQQLVGHHHHKEPKQAAVLEAHWHNRCKVEHNP